MDTNKVVGVTTITGGDALVFEDGTINSLVEVEGVNGSYFVSVPVDIESALKAEDAGNTDYSALPGYVPTPTAGASTGQLNTAGSGQLISTGDGGILPTTDSQPNI